VGEHSEDHTQYKYYSKYGGSVSGSYGFFSFGASGSKTTDKTINTDAARDVNVSFKVRAVQIHRPWLDLAILKVRNFYIPGQASNSWSTGDLSNENKGSFPLLPTQIIVAKDIKVTASKFNQEVSESLKSFDAKARVGYMVSCFDFFYLTSA